MRNSSRFATLLCLCSPMLLFGCDNPSDGLVGRADAGSGTGGSGGSGGSPSSGGQSGSGGKQTGGTPGRDGANGGNGGSGSGGASGGNSGNGGSAGAGGTASPDASPGVGGKGGVGASTTSGGNPGTGGTGAGGSTGSGGKTGSGGSSVTGGATGNGGPDSGAAGDAGATGGKTGAGGTSGLGGTSGSGGAVGAGGAASCTTAEWNPPDTVNGNTGVVDGLKKVWEHSGAVITAAPNIKMYQVMANKGSLNYCARWVSDTPISAAERKQVEALISKCDHQWLDKLTGWGCWPYSDVQVKVVLWAVKNKSVLTDWSDTEGKYVENSAADCPADCGPWDPKQSYPNCKTVHYDEFFWLDGTKTDYTGWGSATGFYMALDPFMRAAKANANTETIVAHEMGHSHGLDDFYDWQPAGWKTFVMLAGSSTVVTDTDGWMLRDVWRHVRSKYGYPAP